MNLFTKQKLVTDIEKKQKTKKQTYSQQGEPEIKLPTSAGSLKRQKNARKTSISALLTMPKPLTVWITIKCGKL